MSTEKEGVQNVLIGFFSLKEENTKVKVWTSGMYGVQYNTTKYSVDFQFCMFCVYKVLDIPKACQRTEYQWV